MRVDDLLTWITRGCLLLIAALTLADLIRHRDRARTDIALMFGALAAIVLIQGLTAVMRQQVPWLGQFGAILLFAQPYLLLRLIQHFRPVPRPVQLVALGGMVISWIILVAVPAPLPPPLALLIVTYFVSVEGYAAVAFARGALRTSGVTHHRLLLAAIGSGLLAIVFLLAGVNIALPTGTGITTPLSRLLALVCILSYYLGFVPPHWLRQAWQLSELQHFLQGLAGRAAGERLTTTLNQLCLTSTRAVGGLGAAVALCDTSSQRLAIRASSGHPALVGSLTTSSGALARAWHARQPTVARSPADFDREVVPLAAAVGAAALLVVPITTAERIWGLLVVFLHRGPLFATDDLNLLALLAEQSAITLDNADLQREIVERERAEAARSELLKQTQAAVQARDQFLSIASHELKTPLTSLLGYVYVLQRRATKEGSWSERNLQSLQVIGNQAQRLNKLVDAMLDLSRIEGGQLNIERVPLDLAALVQRVVAEMQPNLEGQTVELHHPNEQFVIAGDELRLEQVIHNLIGNAAKYSLTGGVIHVDLGRNTTKAWMTVTDHGIGIPQAALPNLFQRFYRASNVNPRQISGVGIGLYVVKEIVTLHGGEVHVASTEGQGSTFTICLPLIVHQQMQSHADAHEAVQEDGHGYSGDR
jgi:signal transduction histidine kinase